MTTYGLTAAGFVPEPLAQIKTDLEAAFQGAFGNDIDVSPEGPFGEFIGIAAERESTQWQLGQAVAAAFDPDEANDTQLDDLCGLTGVVRLIATLSLDSIVAIGTDGTDVPAGTTLATSPNASQFATLADATIATLSAWAGSTVYAAFGAAAIGALVTNDGGKIYACTSPGTSGSSGGPTGIGAVITGDGTAVWRYVGTGTAAVGVLVAAQSTGPTSAPAGTLTTIGSPVFGLASVVNPVDALPGRDIETDTDLRARRDSLLVAEGSSPLPAIRNALLQVASVTSVRMYENASDVVDGAGRPPHSVEAVVQGGLDASIAAALFRAVGGGIATTGTDTSNTVTDPVTGITYVMAFTRPVPVAIYVAVTVKKGPTYPASGGAALIQQTIANFALGLDSDNPLDVPYPVGATVYAGPLAGCLFDGESLCPGIADVTSLFIGTSASPSTSTPVSMAVYYDFPDFQTANITVTET